MAYARRSVYNENNAENAAPRGFGYKNGGGLADKPVVGGRYRTRSRNALGDISNRVPAGGNDGMGIKKRAVRPRMATRYSQDYSSRPRREVAHTRSSSAVTRSSVSNFSPDAMEEEDLSMEALQLNCSFDEDKAHDPLHETEYISNIVDHLFQSERKRLPKDNYMDKQADINSKMREILMDWLVEVHNKFKLRQETLYLTQNIIDRFLERRAVSRTKLQLVGCTAMLIASKYEEIYAPEVRDFVYISDKAYSRDQILTMETIMLNCLGFNLTVPSALRFVERFTQVARANEDQTHLANYLLERTLQDYKSLRFTPSQKAAGALLLARRVLGLPWTSSLENNTRYTEHQLQPVAHHIYTLASAQSHKYRAVKKKYANPKFLRVSTIPIPENLF